MAKLILFLFAFLFDFVISMDNPELSLGFITFGFAIFYLIASAIAGGFNDSLKGTSSGGQRKVQREICEVFSG